MFYWVMKPSSLEQFNCVSSHVSFYRIENYDSHSHVRKDFKHILCHIPLDPVAVSQGKTKTFIRAYFAARFNSCRLRTTVSTRISAAALI